MAEVGKNAVENGDDSSEYETDDEEVEVVTEGLKTMERELSEPDDDDVTENSGKGKKQGFIARTFSKSGSSGGIVRTISRSFSKSNQGMSRGMSKNGGLMRTFSRASAQDLDQDEVEAAAAKSEAYKAISEKKAITYSAPTFLFAPYGLNAAMDLLALFHNGIRQELKNSYHLLSVMERMFASLTHETINSFFDYWEVLWHHVQDYFTAEEAIFWHAVDKRVKMENPKLGSQARGKHKAKLILFYEELSKDMDEKFSLMPASEALKGVRYMINKAVSSLLDYFMIMEKSIPEILKSNFNDKELVGLEKDVFQYMLNKGQCVWANAHIPVRWQSEPAAYQTIVGRHFPKLKMLDFKRWQKTFEKEHELLLKNISALSKQAVTGKTTGAGQGEMVPQFYLDKARRKADGLDSESEVDEDDGEYDPEY
uniref:Uncharacterized protein n=1 Tax=Timspurckia oligopyrenoides TaxID=708627 RepID=A0A7S1ETT3_9RHOD|mmetsp:Transcript_7400/g.13355  ORF Transcript_7400/g.13355 Transcript_7400/m.13355 type:complete len:425 (+) Transcript_7400:131-1405(+)|eukprot:CAMPEP_0182445994 /NCGR_PEP_ID=MMETSP1172-20130603/3915_1 /TAXON_ID=708627 /ORGANISM="Timspurckia oligopyrenoides, Strain CCMP3278" /LENGTH=424 /DNA_ID=CAMNT_0024641849 /DNA_START=134 /DNA_END=1408 /DNA_ORIENTATION=-